MLPVLFTVLINSILYVHVRFYDFPNPANDRVQLVFPAPDPNTECRFVLDDSQGRQVLELPAIQNGIAEFSLNRLPGGMYIGRLIFDNTVIATEKITVVQ